MNIFRTLIHCFSQLSSALLPTQCLLCNRTLDNKLLCYGCQVDLPWLERYPYRCRQCALPLASPANLCGQCLQQPPGFRESLIPFAYEYPLTPLIHRFKYGRKLTYGKLLGQAFAQYILEYADTRDNWRKPELLIPVPMHWTRRWQRGFNQAEILSQYVSYATGIAGNSYLVERRQRNSAQKELTRRERQKNLRGVFRTAPQASTEIRGKCIAVVDDVVTTTATVRELSQVLLNAGASEVQVWALARTMNR